MVVRTTLLCRVLIFALLTHQSALAGEAKPGGCWLGLVSRWLANLTKCLNLLQSDVLFLPTFLNQTLSSHVLFLAYAGLELLYSQDVFVHLLVQRSYDVHYGTFGALERFFTILQLCEDRQTLFDF